jgi:hypothetical protein
MKKNSLAFKRPTPWFRNQGPREEQYLKIAHLKTSATLCDRIILSLSRSRCVDGLWIGSSGQKHSELALGRVEEALGLVKTYDRVRYNRLIRDLERVLVTVLSGSAGSYNSSIGACQLDERFVLAGTSPAVIASAIVHEAAHARFNDAALVIKKK